ncbi:DUF362 domain-containing protein [Calorimonas adulescens]|uniref:Ferredoxin n=1 Tax=Calorimonas adulescens TaxID=2606906 RepID=A0A5D8QHP3_9THEO|nr:DUF362 domain-containing protein [Calorimonas adulescens]TZE82818.1 DUF362 domain-containing protein [Calorimonas adulescens]
MKAKVYFANLRATSRATSLVNKVGMLFEVAGFKDIIVPNEPVAVKMHFGEKGNTAFLNPIYVREVVNRIKKYKGKPFLTDANTLYKGSRSNSVDHINTAIENGFAYAVVNAPIIISDGIFSQNFVEVEINKKHFDKVKIASDIFYTQSMMVLAHFKGHDTAGFGGAIKSLGMGCASAAGKQQQHSTAKPHSVSKCRTCRVCAQWCPTNAITVLEDRISIDQEKCNGCGECIPLCPDRAIEPEWGTKMDEFVERMTEYAYGAMKGKEGRLGFINFVMDVSPLCDCTPWSDVPIVPDIGILASTDPVAIDQASMDLVNKAQAMVGSVLDGHYHEGQDKFEAANPDTKGYLQLSYAEQLGMGSRDYELVEVI